MNPAQPNEQEELGRFSCRCFLITLLCLSVAACGIGAIFELDVRVSNPHRYQLAHELSRWFELIVYALGLTSVVTSIIGLVSGFLGFGSGIDDANPALCSLGIALNGTALASPIVVLLLFG